MTLAAIVAVDSVFGRFLSVLAILSSILTALGSMPTILKIQKQKSVKEYPALPYFSAFVCSALWLTYGFLVKDTTIIASNIFNISLALFYVTMYCLYVTKNKGSIVLLQSFVSLIAIGAMAVAYHFQWQVPVSIAAMILFVIFLASPLSVILKVIETKSCESLPLELPCAVFINGLAYALYGYLVLNDVTLWGTGLVSMFLASIQIACHFLYSNLVERLNKQCCASCSVPSSYIEEGAKDSVEIDLVENSVLTV